MNIINHIGQLPDLPIGTTILENLPADEAEAWRKGEDGIWWSGARGTADGRKIHMPAAVLQWGESL